MLFRSLIHALGSPAGAQLTWWVSTPGSAVALTPAQLRVCTVSGRVIRRIGFVLPPATRRTARAGGSQALVRWDLRDDAGRRVPAGRYFAVVEVDGQIVSGSALVD